MWRHILCLISSAFSANVSGFDSEHDTDIPRGKRRLYRQYQYSATYHKYWLKIVMAKIVSSPKKGATFKILHSHFAYVPTLLFNKR